MSQSQSSGAAAFDPDAPIRSPDDLLTVFHVSEKPRERWRIGAEAEKFGVHVDTGAPLHFHGDRGVEGLFARLARAHDWVPKRETEDGPVLSLERGGANITLEPAAQLELSGAPHDSVHEICAEMRLHLAELEEPSRELGLVWLGLGFHPFATMDDLPWVPKLRYPIMKSYMPSRGARALDMMRRTATVQANFDYSDEVDALAKLTSLLRVSPIITAIFANSPFFEGRRGPRKSERADVWLHMDVDRSGLLEPLWRDGEIGYRDYVEWALDVPMFLVKRGSRVLRNAGQTFRSFLADGFEGERARMGDWDTHLNTLFPEVRLKRTLEVRACDSLPQRMACAVPALYAGLIYDADAFDALRELSAPLEYERVAAAREEVSRVGLAATIGDRSVRELAEQLVDIALGGLERRARLTPSGESDERAHLEQIVKLVGEGLSPADLLTEGIEPGAAVDPATVIERAVV